VTFINRTTIDYFTVRHLGVFASATVTSPNKNHPVCCTSNNHPGRQASRSRECHNCHQEWVEVRLCGDSRPPSDASELYFSHSINYRNNNSMSEPSSVFLYRSTIPYTASAGQLWYSYFKFVLAVLVDLVSTAPRAVAYSCSACCSASLEVRFLMMAPAHAVHDAAATIQHRQCRNCAIGGLGIHMEVTLVSKQRRGFVVTVRGRADDDCRFVELKVP